jgi:hypothetical protein
LLLASGRYGGCQDFDAGSAVVGEAVMQDAGFPPTCAASCPDTCDPSVPSYQACPYCLEACVDVCESSPAACAASPFLEIFWRRGPEGPEIPSFLGEIGVEPTRIELVTSSMPWMRSPS